MPTPSRFLPTSSASYQLLSTFFNLSQPQPILTNHSKKILFLPTLTNFSQSLPISSIYQVIFTNKKSKPYWCYYQQIIQVIHVKDVASRRKSYLQLCRRKNSIITSYSLLFCLWPGVPFVLVSYRIRKQFTVYTSTYFESSKHITTNRHNILNDKKRMEVTPSGIKSCFPQ